MLFTDSGSGRAEELAREVGGEAVRSNRKLAEAADIVVLAVKPAQLDEVAGELASAKVVITLLGATSMERVAAAFPRAEVVAGDAERRGGGPERRPLCGRWGEC